MKHVPSPFPSSDPTSIYRHRDGVLAVELLVAALCHFDLFSLLAKRALTASELCAELGLDARAADVMLTLLVAMEYLERDGEVVRATLKAREFLAADSPWSLVPYYESMRERPACRTMVDVLRTGVPASWAAQDEEWAVKMADPEFARSFTAEMNCRGVYLGSRLAESVDLSGHSHVLDVGGGSGIYAASLVAANEHLAATVLEKPPVDAIAAREIAARGLEARVATVAGDMFAPPLPSGADVHLYSNVLHDWGESAVRQLLAHSHAALPPGGLVVIHDAFVNREKTGPLHVAEYSVLLMHYTEGKCYSLGEMQEYLSAAGFRDVSHRDVAAARGVVTARR